MNDKDPAAEMLQQRYPRWQVWQADTGEWWASVRKNLTPSQERAGCLPHVHAETPRELEQLILEEDARA